MIPSDPRPTRLADAASVLLFGGDDDRRIGAAAASLDRLFRGITGMREDTADPRDRSATSAPAGSAISPLDAGRCLLDPRRTAIYLRGVHDAIQEARQRFPGELIHVLYAGCGPFAPLCLPLLPLLAGQAVRLYESGLTHPLIVNGWRAGEEVEFTYRLGEKPGFHLVSA